MKLLYLAGNALAAFLDFAVGIFVIVAMSSIWGMELSPWLLIIGGVAAFLPDFDIIWLLISRGKPSGDHHQTILHRPLAMILFVSLLTFLVGGSFWSVTISLCLFWHYMHDTRGFGGGGIAWFWPLSRKYWSLSGGEEPERSEMAKSESNHEEWVRTTWLRPSRTSIRDVTIGSLLLGIALAITVGVQIGFATIVATWLAVGCLWTIHSCCLNKPVSK